MEINQIFKILKTRKLIVYQAVVIIFAVAMAVTYFQKPVYQATATILFKEKDISSSMLFGNIFSQFGSQPERSLQTQIKLITLRPLLQNIIDKLKLNIEPESLRKKIDIKSESNANLLNISVKDESAYKAAKIANTLVEEYLNSSKQITTTELTRARQEVYKKLKDTEEEIIAIAKETAKKKGSIPDDLKAKLDMATGIYIMLAEKHEQLRISEELRTSDALLMAPAVVPENPVFPKPVQTAIVSLLGGLMVGIAFAFGIDQLDNTIRTTEDAEAIFKLPVIGQIPYQDSLAKLDDKILVKSHPKSTGAEACRTVRTNIEYFNAEKNMKTIMIASANPQEGKSVVSINIATAFAQTGKRVVLISCDLRKPSIHIYTNTSNTKGLSNYLAGYTEIVADIVQDSSVENLKIITSGPIPPNPSELLGSKRMEQLLNELREKMDYIIFDTTPILAVTDSTVMAKYTDGAIIISDYKRTSREDAKKATSALKKTGVRQLGVILNNIPVSIIYPYGSYQKYSYIKDKSSKTKLRKKFTLS